jgi:hypothetical protein
VLREIPHVNAVESKVLDSGYEWNGKLEFLFPRENRPPGRRAINGIDAIQPSFEIRHERVRVSHEECELLRMGRNVLRGSNLRELPGIWPGDWQPHFVIGLTQHGELPFFGVCELLKAFRERFDDKVDATLPYHWRIDQHMWHNNPSGLNP